MRGEPWDFTHYTRAHGNELGSFLSPSWDLTLSLKGPHFWGLEHKSFTATFKLVGFWHFVKTCKYFTKSERKKGKDSRKVFIYQYFIFLLLLTYGHWLVENEIDKTVDYCPKYSTAQSVYRYPTRKVLLVTCFFCCWIYLKHQMLPETSYMLAKKFQANSVDRGIWLVGID